jgi:hypothetical protein
MALQNIRKLGSRDDKAVPAPGGQGGISSVEKKRLAEYERDQQRKKSGGGCTFGRR